LRFPHAFSHHTPSSTTPILVENKFASSTTVERAGTAFSVDVNTPTNNSKVHHRTSNINNRNAAAAPVNHTNNNYNNKSQSITCQLAQDADKIMNVMTGRLKDLDYVWRPVEISLLTSTTNNNNNAAQLQQQQQEQQHLKNLNQQLKQSNAFVKHVTLTLKKKLATEPGDAVHCFTMMYNVIASARAAADNPAVANEHDFDYEDDDEEEESSAAQWTSVVAVVMDEDGQVKKSVMVLQTPDSSAQFSRESLINILDVAEVLGCENVYVAVNKCMSPATERVHITKGFMNVGFQMQHPRVLSVDGHVVLGYEF